MLSGAPARWPTARGRRASGVAAAPRASRLRRASEARARAARFKRLREDLVVVGGGACTRSELPQAGSPESGGVFCALLEAPCGEEQEKLRSRADTVLREARKIPSRAARPDGGARRSPVPPLDQLRAPPARGTLFAPQRARLPSCRLMCCTPSRNSKRHLPRRATRYTVWPRWPSRAKAGKTASALRFADLMSTDSTCSSSSATCNDVRFELKHPARMGAT